MDSSLRWWLLGIGLLIMAAIYLFGSMRKSQGNHGEANPESTLQEDLEQVHIRSSNHRLEPTLGDMDPLGEVAEDAHSPPVRRGLFNRSRKAPKPPKPQLAQTPSLHPDAPPERIGPQKSDLSSKHRMFKRPATPDDSKKSKISTATRRGISPDPAPREIQRSTNHVQRQEPEKIIALHVAASAPNSFYGLDILKALQACGLEYGELDIFHRMVEHSRQRVILFSVASMVNPGVLIPKEMSALQTPGLALIMRLPGPWDGVMAFDSMLLCAEELADHLSGVVLDQRREVSSKQAHELVREDIRSWEFKLQHTGYL